MQKRTDGMLLLGLLSVMLGMMVQAAEETMTYQYDAAGRLLVAGYTVDDTNAVIQFQYDVNGNRTNRVDYSLGDPTDSDGNSLKDVDEIFYFGSLGQAADGDPDGDGLVTSNELKIAGNPALADTDYDGQNDYDEWIAGTPLNDGAVWFHVVNVEDVGGGQARISWDVVVDRTYQLQKTYQVVGTWTNVGSPYVCSSSGSYYQDYPLETNAHFRVQVEWTE